MVAYSFQTDKYGKPKCKRRRNEEEEEVETIKKITYKYANKQDKNVRTMDGTAILMTIS